MTTQALSVSGAMVWQGRILVYGRDAERWWFRFLGEKAELTPTPQLLEAVEADQRHQRNKQSGSG